MERFRIFSVVVMLVLAVGSANAQLVVEDFDAQVTGAPPAWRWWNNGTSGTVLVDETIFYGSSGKSVALVRTTFDGAGFGFGRNFPPIDGPAELSFFFRVDSTTEETLTAVGGNNADGQVAWWVGVGGAVGNAIGTYSAPGGWNHVMDVVAETWYGVTLKVVPASSTYDITVWEDGNPGNTGLVIENNSIGDGFIGIHFMGNSGCSILDNVMRNGWRGIFLDAIMGCPDVGTEPGCFHATGNLVSGNDVAGYFIDLYHHELAIGNTWTNNACLTKEGAEIPPCVPTP